MGNLREEVHVKCIDIKNKIKDLNNILDKLYNTERINIGKNIYHIKSTLDKVSSASKHVCNVKYSAQSEEGSAPAEDITKLHKATIKNILVLEEFYKNKLRKEVQKKGSKSFNETKRNIDSIRRAYADLKRLDPNMNLKSKDWNVFEKEI